MSDYDLWLLPPDAPDLADDPGTRCLGHYEATSTDDAYTCDQRSACYLCGGVVCAEHDDGADCSDGPAHEGCHDRGCWSAGCEQDRRDDALLAWHSERDALGRFTSQDGDYICSGCAS